MWWYPSLSSSRLFLNRPASAASSIFITDLCSALNHILLYVLCLLYLARTEPFRLFIFFIYQFIPRVALCVRLTKSPYTPCSPLVVLFPTYLPFIPLPFSVHKSFAVYKSSVALVSRPVMNLLILYIIIAFEYRKRVTLTESIYFLLQ